ncbi:hypothetical protein ERJ75_000252900 [Trypanosoma vivax]|nr:hypothetical protein TRVL_10025 [Trypanosoma vivax]KAH8618730.1 hypothetical protein ERJ75_000252900 [Trypanosoma vivax]
MATPPEQLFAAFRDMFPMPSKPGFLLQDAWDEMALWLRAVGNMVLADGLNRPGKRVYNRWRLLRMAGECLGVQAEPPSGAPKGPRKEEGSHHQARRQDRRNNKRLCRATCDAFAAGEWGTTA